jgi:hypothetical protein
MEYKPRMMQGRLTNGAQADHGKLVHAVDIEGKKVPHNNQLGYRWIYPALCGRKPGAKSVGWSTPEGVVNCPKCLKKLSKSEF